MRNLSIGTLAFALVGLVGLALIVIGPPDSRPSALPQAPPAPAPSSVTAAGFTLVSTSIDLPLEDSTFPDGPHADVINANCTSCHSTSMALNQPALSADQWKATVTKMRDAYKAPIKDEDVPAIVDYLTALSTAQEGSLTGEPGGSVPDSKPDNSGSTG